VGANSSGQRSSEVAFGAVDDQEGNPCLESIPALLTQYIIILV
jgi:hypothetical protein